jgi:uncharacterized protein YkwD
LVFVLILVPTSLLAADGPGTLDRKLVDSVRAAVSHGAGVYNVGDHAGCCRVFEGALSSLKPLLEHRPELQQEIDRGTVAANSVADAAERAFKLRAALIAVAHGIDPSVKDVVLTSYVKPEEFELTAEEREVVDLTNRYRAAYGLPALRPNPRLFTAARLYSAVMARFDRIGHSVDGSGLSGRVYAAGYGWSSLAENVAAGQTSPTEALSSWMTSPGHRSNILGQHGDIGIGVAISPNGTRYWAQVFASQ